jgi:hypothetical protein
MASTEGTQYAKRSAYLSTCSRKSKDCTKSVQKHSSTVRSFTQALDLVLSKLESTTLHKPSLACLPVATVARCLRNNSTSRQWVVVEAQVASLLQPTTKGSALQTRGLNSKTLEVTASGLPHLKPTRLTVQVIATHPQVWAVEDRHSEVSSLWAVGASHSEVNLLWEAQTLRMLLHLQSSRRPLTL